MHKGTPFIKSADIKRQIIDKLNIYNLINSFENEKNIANWISKLNYLQINNFLSLDIDPNLIEFDTKLLINKDLLNKNDYLSRVSAFVSIKNAEGWYHLFENMLKPEFLKSEKFYQDIEMLKKAECAPTPLWIIGEKSFVNSPYHDEDFELLVTARDNSDKKLDFVLWEVIATIAANVDSINSEYHRIDLNTIMKYGSDKLQMSHSYPEHSISYLAINKVSLNDPYHLENMDLLANNSEIDNFLYLIMTDEQIVKKPFYRQIIQEMIDNKNNKYIAFMLCYYAVGLKKVKSTTFMDQVNYEYIISRRYNIEELLKKIDEIINDVEGDYHEITRYEIESTSPEKIICLTKAERLFQNNDK